MFGPRHSRVVAEAFKHLSFQVQSTINPPSIINRSTINKPCPIPQHAIPIARNSPPRSPAQAQARSASDERALEAAAVQHRVIAGDGSPADAFIPTETVESEKRDKLASDIVSMLPARWQQSLCSKDGDSRLPLAARQRVAINILRRSGVSALSKAKGALVWWLQWTADNEFDNFPAPADMCAASLEEYDDRALQRGVVRSAKRAKSCNLDKPGRNDRGGECAVAWVRHGYQLLENKLNLPFDSKDEMVRAIARSGKGMPNVASATPFDLIAHADACTRNPSLSTFTRAYCGAAYLNVASSLRKIDAQRSGKIHFEKVMVEDNQYTIACGIARKSKAKRQDLMRPLAWRAPLIPIASKTECVDLTPLMSSLPSEGGCMYRGFNVPKGKPISIIHATSWSNLPATHAVIVKSIQDIAQLSPLRMPSQRATAIGGHDDRHVLPEIGRVASLPRHIRECLGYWTSAPEIADDPSDQAAIARAHMRAREQRKSSGPRAFMCDQYASQDAQPIEQDRARISCMLLLARAVQAGPLPTSVREQLGIIADICAR